MSATKKGVHKKHQTTPAAGHTGEYKDQIGNPSTVQLSDAQANQNRSGGNLAGPTMWGQQNGMDMGTS
jgi:hypothetical protein